MGSVALGQVWPTTLYSHKQTRQIWGFLLLFNYDNNTLLINFCFLLVQHTLSLDSWIEIENLVGKQS
ncbi:hypothetical protein pb186bvf_005204 [Paramecium bursaria]